MATGAQAQDLTAHDWSGVYLGASIGGVGGSGKVEATTSDGFVGSYFTSPDPEQIAATVAGPLSQWRATGGVFAGYGQQWDNLYLAVEGSANSLSFDGSRSSGAVYLSNPDGQFTHRLSATADWQATVRARLGLAQDRWLGYVTGGAAVTRIKLDATFADDFLGAGAAGHSASDDTVLGFVLGSGGEYALNDRWTARVEYLYADYGKVSTSSVVTNPAFPVFSNDLDTSFRFRTHTISVGLHHRF
ncbi:hypothetical protein ASC75_11105 [Aminobacter sp. DSM 101952]|nr:hypothetical protein ASC75_11105 [Aminobacter sp. DSM 101952]